MTATIHYYDIGDYLDRETKLNKLNELKSIENIYWQDDRKLKHTVKKVSSLR
ncbi:MAG: hypothetical protein LBC68_03655 [Prevotellaceae bacterium]|jgi:predicted helicase|nr:hypothetical protein [Prevotellaceae bacterium]